MSADLDSQLDPVADRPVGFGRIAIPGIIFALTFFAFSRSLLFPLLDWDDRAFLIENSGYRGFDWPHLRWMLTTFLGGPYQPLSWFSYAIDFAVWGPRPFGFHLTNVLMHSAAAVAMYYLAARLL